MNLKNSVVGHPVPDPQQSRASLASTAQSNDDNSPLEPATSEAMASLPAADVSPASEAGSTETVVNNPYSAQLQQQALEKMLPPSEEPMEKRLAAHHEQKFNTYLEQASLSTVGPTEEDGKPAASPASQPVHEEGGDAGSKSAVNPYEKLKRAPRGEEQVLSAEEQEAEFERRAQRFASYIQNAKRSN